MKLLHEQVLTYLPYGLKCELLNYQSDYVGKRYAVCNGFYISGGLVYYTFGDRSIAGKTGDLIKPFLKPMSDLKAANIDGLEDLTKSAVIYLQESKDYPFNPHDLVLKCIYYADIMKLIRNHFDVFGLIEKGLAHNINKVKYEQV